jgi:hypothetical protein
MFFYLGGAIGYALREMQTIKVGFHGQSKFMVAYVVVRFAILDALIWPYVSLKALL